MMRILQVVTVLSSCFLLHFKVAFSNRKSAFKIFVFSAFFVASLSLDHRSNFLFFFFLSLVVRVDHRSSI